MTGTPHVDPTTGKANYLDFPTAWRLQREGLTHGDPQCSAAQTGGAFLCDCGAVTAAWEAAGRPAS